MKPHKHQSAIDKQVSVMQDEWKLIQGWIARREHREASYGLTRLACEAKKLKQTIVTDSNIGKPK